MKTSQKILEYIRKNGQASGKELVDVLGDITPRAVRKQLKGLLESGALKKIGRPPKVFYLLADSADVKILTIGADALVVAAEVKRKIDERYLYITPAGEMVPGWNGFAVWCEKTKQDPVKTAGEYVATLRKYDAFSKDGLIDATRKMRETFPGTPVDKLYYLDFYSIERFGKTRIGQILLHAKNSQDKTLIRSLAEEMRSKVRDLLDRYAIDGVLFVPPTIRREVQLMRELEKYLHLSVRTLSVSKVKMPITVAQKTLSKLEDRIENARKTIVVEEDSTFRNILLIDDAVGSGSTLNETAVQIRRKGLCQGKIIGLSIAGSFNGFDVISEV